MKMKEIKKVLEIGVIVKEGVVAVAKGINETVNTAR